MYKNVNGRVTLKRFRLKLRYPCIYSKFKKDNNNLKTQAFIT
jgi:hypothetical protein